MFKQLQRLDKDDQRLKESMAAVVRSQLDNLVKADQNGQGGVLKMKVTAPVTVPAEVGKELATPPAGQQLPMPETHEAELRASSLFEGAVNGM